MFCLSIHQLMGIWIVPSLVLLWIMLLWTSAYASLCEHVFSSLLGRFLGVELLNQVANLTFYENARLFSKVSAPFSILTGNIWGIQFLNIFVILGFLLTPS